MTRAPRRCTPAALALVALLAAGTAGAVGDDLRTSQHPDWEPGLEAIRSKEWSEAVEHFRAVVRNEPDNADAHNWLAYAYRNRRDLARAIAAAP